MNKKDNQRTRLTKMLMKTAYVALMHEKQPAKITVREICERSEINRSTFYLHYGEPNDILIELEDEAIRKMSDSLRSIGTATGNATDAARGLLGFLRYVRENDDLFRTFLVENTDPHFRRKLREVALLMITSSFSVEIPKERETIVYSFLVGGSLDVLSDWIRDDYATDERALCKMIFGICEGALRGA